MKPRRIQDLLSAEQDRRPSLVFVIEEVLPVPHPAGGWFWLQILEMVRAAEGQGRLVYVTILDFSHPWGKKCRGDLPH